MNKKYTKVIKNSIIIMGIIIIFSCTNRNASNQTIILSQSASDISEQIDETAIIDNRALSFEHAYTGAPELRNVMPNSWQRLNRLTEEAERIFFEENTALMDTITKHLRGIIQPYYEERIWYVRVYEERAGFDIFFRILFSETETFQLDDFGHQFVQALVYKSVTRNILIIMSVYNNFGGGQFNVTCIFTSIDIIRFGDRAMGVLVTTLEVPIDEDEDNRPFYAAVSNLGTYGSYPLEQPAGRGYARYYLMSDVHEDMEIDNYGVYPRIPVIRISVSDSFVDPQSPLRHALQSAFDGNPATSYVVNTQDGLFTISFLKWYNTIHQYRPEPMLEINRLAIINGNIQSETSYFAYNRIRKMRGHGEAEFLDDVFDFQFADIQPCQFGSINVSELFRGERYNYTAITGLNIKADQLGWLFGDMYE
jgi:hypothetical protein